MTRGREKAGDDQILDGKKIGGGLTGGGGRRHSPALPFDLNRALVVSPPAPPLFLEQECGTKGYVSRGSRSLANVEENRAGEV